MPRCQWLEPKQRATVSRFSLLERGHDGARALPQLCNLQLIPQPPPQKGELANKTPRPGWIPPRGSVTKTEGPAGREAVGLMASWDQGYFSFPFFFSLPPLAEPLPPSISPRGNSKATSRGKGLGVVVTDTAGNQRCHSVGTSLMPSSHAANNSPHPQQVRKGLFYLYS